MPIISIYWKFVSAWCKRLTANLDDDIFYDDRTLMLYLCCDFMDRLTKEQRHKNMSAIKNKDSKIEQILRKELWSRGLHYRKNVNSVYGKPDIAFIGKKIAIFCDSEFWHGYNWNEQKNNFKSNTDFWFKKIERNIQRDKEVNENLLANGWLVLRFWGNDIKKNTVKIADEIEIEYRNR